MADRAAGDAPRAVKVVPPVEAARLRWEFDTLARIAHPNVARVYELLTVAEPVGEPVRLGRGDVALVEQYAEGRSAADAADALGTDLTTRVRWTLRVGRGVAAGLAAIHAAGLIHADVKPANIVVTADGTPVLVDLGLARPPGVDTRVAGTPGYLAPEAWTGERSVATDLWALGATLRRLVAGRDAPSESRSRSAAEWIGQALSGPPGGIALPPGVPAPFSRLLDALVDPDPAQRPASAREVGARLAAMEDAGGASTGGGADDVPTAAERAMAVRALPLVGQADALVALTEALAEGGVIALVGPAGSGRGRLVDEAVRMHQRACADRLAPVPTHQSVDGSLPSEALRHDAVMHVTGADVIDAAQVRGLVRAAEVEGVRLAVVLERERLVEGANGTVSVSPLTDAEIRTLLERVLGSAPSPAVVDAAAAASGRLAGRLCRLLTTALAEGRDPSRAGTFAELGRPSATGRWPCPRRPAR